MVREGCLLLVEFAAGKGAVRDFKNFDSLGVQGYLAHKKRPPPRTLQKAYAQGPTVVLGGGGGVFL